MNEKLLIFHPYLAPYRIDLYNRLNDDFNLNVLLYASKGEISTLGFDLSNINSLAKFRYKYFTGKGLYIGRHLLSFSFIREVVSFEPNIVITHELGINTFIGLGLKIFRGTKLFITIDDSPIIFQTRSKLRRFLLGFISKFSTAIFFVNDQIPNLYKAEYLNSATPCFLPLIQNEKRVLPILNNCISNVDFINDDDFVILFVGRLINEKAPDVLLDSFNLLKKPNIKLIFVGEGPLQNRLNQRTIDLNLMNNVFFIGKVTGIELYKWYNIAHIFVLPSRFEPFGAVVNEALICGCYTIVSDNVGASCLITKDNGEVVSNLDKYNLADSIKKGINSLSNREKKSKMPWSFESTYLNLREKLLNT
jgi:glycosyltransferase involved in cell wall biosynthesis